MSVFMIEIKGDNGSLIFWGEKRLNTTGSMVTKVKPFFSFVSLRQAQYKPLCLKCATLCALDAVPGGETVFALDFPGPLARTGDTLLRSYSIRRSLKAYNTSE